MNDVAVVSIIMGALLIMGRGVFIIAPESARDFYLKLLSTNNRIRLFGLVPCALSVAMILSARGDPQIVAQVILWFGYLLAFISFIGCLIFAFIVQLIVQALLEALDNLMMRAVGILSVLLGVVFIYLGVTLLN